MIIIGFSAPDAYWDEYQKPLRQALDNTGLIYDLSPDYAEAAKIDYLVYAPGGPVEDFTPFTRAKAVLGLWAGVENIIDNPTLQIPLTRMVDRGLNEGMREWVLGHALRHHLGIDRHIIKQDGIWRDTAPPLARDRAVTVLGLGTLGRTCAKALSSLNFKVSGWSRNQKTIKGITCYSGEDGLHTVLAEAEILILLLPLTRETRHVINANTLAKLPKGAVIINAGRGELIDDEALLKALEAAHVSHATLDVFAVEPLPPAHPFWAHKRVTVTPHIASQTRSDTASAMIAENIRRCENGEPLLHVVDRDAGY